MLVILEGVDGSGKTMLAEKLREQMGFGYVHVTNPEPGVDVFSHHFDPIRGVIDRTIIDRLHWSDDVYGAVLRGGPGLSAQEFGFIDGYLASKGGMFVLCSPPLDTVLANIARAPGNKNHDDATAVRIWDEYQKPSRSALPGLFYDYTLDPEAKALLNELATMAARLYRDGGSSC